MLARREQKTDIRKRKTVFLICLFAYLLIPTFVFAQLDATAPVTDYSIEPENPDGENNWYVTSPTVTLDATDLQSGVKSINWKVNEGSWQQESFSNTLNLAPNPSFEIAGDPQDPLDSWEVGDPQATYSQDLGISKFGDNSAKIDAVSSGWFSIRNESNFSPTTYLDNMSASLWVKGNNASEVYFEVYALYDDGGVTEKLKITESDHLSGTFDWILLPLAFTVSVPDTFGVYIEMGINGSGTVWFDAINISSSVNPTTTSFAVSEQGEDTLEFYSLDMAENEETPHQNEQFKVDTRAPGNYKNFTKTQTFNDHTFIISVEVDDTASGLDVSTAEFQYFIEDREDTWGYYEVPLICGVSWQADNWLPTSVTPGIDGSNTVTLTTPDIDFCNSSWQHLKKIRFKITDMAGNVGTSPDLVINGPWVKVDKGDIYSEFDVQMGSRSEGEYLIRSGRSINNITSLSDWYISYESESIEKQDYEWWKLNFPPAASLPEGNIPSESGRYEVGSDFTLNSSSLNDFDEVENATVVVFVDGHLIVDVDYTLTNTSALIFIVSGDVIIDDSRDEVEGFFIVDGIFQSQEGNSDLVVKGGVLANSFELLRSLPGNQNEGNPSELFNFDPKYLVLGSDLLGVLGSLKWREVSYRTPPPAPVGQDCSESGGVCCSESQTGIGTEYPEATDCPGSCFESCDNRPESFVGVWLKWNNYVIFSLDASDDEDPDHLLSCILNYGDGSESDLDCRFGFWAHVFSCPAGQECTYTANWEVTDTIGGSTTSATGVLIENYGWRF